MTHKIKSFLQVIIAIVFMFGAFGTVPARPVEAASTNVVISEVYGGGGNSGALYRNDFIELFNLGLTAVDLSTWSVQYASSTGTTWYKTNLTGSIQPGAFYLIQEASGASTTQPLLPTPDVIGTIAMGKDNGKVALVNSTELIIGTGNPIPGSVVDFVGYGSANAYETAAAPTLTNSTSASRTKGAPDTDNNAVDFTVGAPTPQNSVGLGTDPSNGSIGVALDANIMISFFDVVTPAAGWYSLVCSISGNHPAVVSPEGANKSFTINPDTNFTYSEACTLTINGSLLTPVITSSPIIKFSTVVNMTDSCGEDFTKISAIQGVGSSSPFAGLQTVTEGVITADLKDTKQGFYIQDPNPDLDPLSSEGLFVYMGSTDYMLFVGATVRVAGTVTEYNGLTEIPNPVRLLNCGYPSVPVMPVELDLPFADTGESDLEKYENMLVHFAQPLVINEYYNFDRYGEIVLSSKRLETPTNVVAPGAEAVALQALNDLDKITLDDGVSAQYPEYLPHPNGERFCHGNLVSSSVAPDCTDWNYFRGGDTVSDLTAVVDYVAGGWKLVKTQPAIYTAVNQRTEAPLLVPGELRISSLNTLNYFITLDNTTVGAVCGPDGIQECRGAENNDEFNRQREKIIAAVKAMNADIIGLLELENDNLVTTATLGEDYAIENIIVGLSADPTIGAGTYDRIETGAIGGDAIKVGLMYKPARVTPVGVPAYLTSTFNSAFVDTCNRPVLAQTFRDNITQELFTVAVNHLKSKGSACSDSLAPTLDADLGDSQGASNYTRTQAAQVEVEWLESNPTGAGSQSYPMYLIIGDLNSYAMEDPITAIKKGADDIAGTADDYLDLVQHFKELKGYPQPYGYVFDAQAGYLDGALANKRMASYVLDAKHWHINADEADVIDFNTQIKTYSGIDYRGDAQKALEYPDAYRSSDHDPVLISLMLNHEPEPMDDSYATDMNVPLNVDTAHGVLANDTDDNEYDKINVGSITQPSNGVVVMLPDGSFTYTPKLNFAGVDTFTYTMQATPGLMGAYETLATVTITVNSTMNYLYLPIITK